jgi:hypothetical protein
VPRSWRTTGLRAPLALLGAGAGWHGAALANHPLLDLLPASVLPTGTFGAIVMALFGASFGGRLDQGPAADRQVRAQLILLAAAVGAALGLFRAHWYRPFGGAGPRELGWMTLGVLAGVGYAMVILPLAASMVTAARRAHGAREGSIAAAAGRRETWMTTCAAVAATTLVIAPQWRLAMWELGAPMPLSALAIPLVAGLLAFGVLVANVVALWRVRRACRGWGRMQIWDGDAATVDAERIDLGLGDEVKGWVDGGVNAYRDRGRPVWLVIGDPTATRAALRDGIGRALVAGLAAIMVVCAHAAAGMQWRVVVGAVVGAF